MTRVVSPVIADKVAIPQVSNNLANNLVPSADFENENYGDSFVANFNMGTGISSASNVDFQAISTSNPQKNGGNTPPPTMTMFGEDANTFLDQLVILPTKKELHSVSSMKGSEVQLTINASNEGLLGGSDDSFKDSNDSKEQTIEDDVFFSNPPVSAMVESQTSNELLSPMKDDSKKDFDDTKDQNTEEGEIHDTNGTAIISDDSKKGSDDWKGQSSEDKDNQENKNKKTPRHFTAHESHLNICEWVLAETDETYETWNESNGSKDYINKTQPPKAKKTGVESIIIVDNKAIPQIDGRASVSSFGSNENCQEILSSNPLENGNTTPPPIMTIFGEDANNFLDQSVRFPASKELNSDDSMKDSSKGQ